MSHWLKSYANLNFKVIFSIPWWFCRTTLLHFSSEFNYINQNSKNYICKEKKQEPFAAAFLKLFFSPLFRLSAPWKYKKVSWHLSPVKYTHMCQSALLTVFGQISNKIIIETWENIFFSNFKGKHKQCSNLWRYFREIDKVADRSKFVFIEHIW